MESIGAADFRLDGGTGPGFLGASAFDEVRFAFEDLPAGLPEILDRGFTR
jgi:hypothetical protein